jgi:starch phosphorylase
MSGINEEFLSLPESISGLGDLAYNLWWGWHPEGRELFMLLDRRAWDLSGHNPVKMLKLLDETVLASASTDPHFLRHYDAMMARLQKDMDLSHGWFCANVADPEDLTIAYFSAEYGLHQALPVYAGGLGFLAGDYLKECSDLGFPAVGIGFMYPEGYLLQKITSDGWQVGTCEMLDRGTAPIRRALDADGSPLIVEIPVLEKPIYVEVWRVQVGRTDLYLMDTSVDANDPWDRSISDRLYTGDPEQRLRQEMVLGIGGVRVLKALGIRPSLVHLNEGHPTFAILERIREKVEEGLSYDEAKDLVRKTTVFTTHTPVPAGHDKFPFPLMEKYFGTYLSSFGVAREEFLKMGVDPKDPAGGFNLTAFALRMSGYRNCVSRRHLEVTRNMWRHLWPDLPEDEIPIDYVTNGVHVPTWIDRRLGNDLFNRYLGRDWLEEHDNPLIWGLIDEIPNDVLWDHHRKTKMRLVNKIKERAREKWIGGDGDPRAIMALGVLLDQDVLTIGFARRFASYKRSTLIFRDAERLKRIVTDAQRPVQIVFAGKAHPDDQQSKLILQQVFNFARDRSFGGRIAFVEDYDQHLAHYLVHGVDLWLNNPRPPMEASGTSGMKATLNGVPQLSILDGWWVEGYNGKNGWAFEGSDDPDRTVRDDRDAASIYDILEKEVIPLYYDVDDEGVPRGWVRAMKEAIRMTGPNFCARRMVKEYMEKFYRPALELTIRPKNPIQERERI